MKKNRFGHTLSHGMPSGSSGEGTDGILAAEGLITADLSGQVRTVNDPVARLLGRAAERCVGLPLDALLDLCDPDGEKVGLLAMARSLGRELTVRRLRLQRPSAGPLAVTVHLGMLRSPAGGLAGIAVILRADPDGDEPGSPARWADRQTQRLEDLGYLARGYAHELNNRLTAILGSLARLEDCLAAGRGDWQPALEGVRQAAVESAGFVRQLQVFSSGGRPVRDPLDPVAWVRGIWAGLPRREGVDYDLDIQSPIQTVAADPSQLEKALENLFANANAAVAVPGGRVTLSLSSRADPGGAVLLFAVEDNGCGIATELVPRLTEPYFTTRANENASGIGLTVCDAIARAHDGGLEIRSSPGTGTTVALVLPVSVAVVPAPTPRPEPPPAAAPAAPRQLAPLRILVLEDEAMVRQAIVFALRREGWEVVETARGEETVAAWEDARAAGHPFDLLVSDLTIRGGMGGVETLQRILSVDPSARALACSGYTDDPVISDPYRFGFMTSLAKPFDPGALVRAVRQVAAAGG